MFKFKKLLQRVKSMESFLGIVYNVPEVEDDYASHDGTEYSLFVRMNERIKELEDLNKK